MDALLRCVGVYFVLYADVPESVGDSIKEGKLVACQATGYSYWKLMSCTQCQVKVSGSAQSCKHDSMVGWKSGGLVHSQTLTASGAFLTSCLDFQVSCSGP